MIEIIIPSALSFAFFAFVKINLDVFKKVPFFPRIPWILGAVVHAYLLGLLFFFVRHIPAVSDILAGFSDYFSTFPIEWFFSEETLPFIISIVVLYEWRRTRTGGLTGRGFLMLLLVPVMLAAVLVFLLGGEAGGWLLLAVLYVGSICFVPSLIWIGLRELLSKDKGARPAGTVPLPVR